MTWYGPLKRNMMLMATEFIMICQVAIGGGICSWCFIHVNKSREKVIVCIFGVYQPSWTIPCFIKRSCSLWKSFETDDYGMIEELKSSFGSSRPPFTVSVRAIMCHMMDIQKCLDHPDNVLVCKPSYNSQKHFQNVLVFFLGPALNFGYPFSKPSDMKNKGAWEYLASISFNRTFSEYLSTLIITSFQL